jgi:hypothetical protein
VTESTEEPPPTGIIRQDVFSALGTLGAIITLAATVMYYFGWRGSDAQAREMSINISLFGFSSQDYVLRRISLLFIPFLVILGCRPGVDVVPLPAGDSCPVRPPRRRKDPVPPHVRRPDRLRHQA